MSATDDRELRTGSAELLILSLVEVSARRVLGQQRTTWRAFAAAINQIASLERG